MNYIGITSSSFVNGSGVRTVLWVAGCSHHCENCQNQFSWNPEGGSEFTEIVEKELFGYLDRNLCDGLTLSGGDPLYLYNRPIVTRLCKRFKYRYADRKTIWLYTGYLWENVKDLPIMQYIDVLVDGPYIDELCDVNKLFVGSSNQRIIDVKKSLTSQEVILYG